MTESAVMVGLKRVKMGPYDQSGSVAASCRVCRCNSIE
jgi:hypothetical protein